MKIDKILPQIPILITTRDPLGGVDIYPTNNFLLLTKDPFIIIISVKANSRCYYNITKTKEFVLNIMGENYKSIMEKCQKEYVRGINEIKEIGLTEEKSSKVKVPRIKEAVLCLECSWIGSVEVDSVNILENYPVFGKVLNGAEVFSK